MRVHWSRLPWIIYLQDVTVSKQSVELSNVSSFLNYRIIRFHQAIKVWNILELQMQMFLTKLKRSSRQAKTNMTHSIVIFYFFSFSASLLKPTFNSFFGDPKSHVLGVLFLCLLLVHKLPIETKICCKLIVSVGLCSYFPTRSASHFVSPILLPS